MAGTWGKRGRNWGRLIGTAILALMLFLAWHGPGWIEKVQMILDDFKFATRGTRPPGDEIAIIAVDDRSLAEIGRWPWPRDIHAALLVMLTEYGVRAVGMSMIFAEPEESGRARQLEEMERLALQLGVESQEYLEALREQRAAEDHDGQLAAAIHFTGQVIMPVVFNAMEAGGELTAAAGDTTAQFRNREYAYSYGSQEILTSIGILNGPAAGHGFIDIFSDPDGVYRWAPLYLRHGEDYYLHYSLHLARRYLGLGPEETAIDFLQGVVLGSRLIPTDALGRMLINYCGPQSTFPTYSYSAVLQGEVPAEALRDRIVLVGSTATGTFDIHATPFDKTFPGVEIHASIIENILHEKYINHFPPWGNLLALAASGLLLIAVLPLLSPVAGLLFALVMAALHLAASFALFRTHTIMDDVYALAMTALVYTAITVYKFVGEESEKRMVKHTFGRFVTGKVMEEILENPEELTLGGGEKQLTVLFSDIRSFTTFSERHQPQEVVSILNEYLEEMTETVFATDGTLDKYVGDEIMAFWGAPHRQEDHARRACLTALAMMARLREKLHPKWKDEGRETLEIGIGVNSGTMLVGYMGSQSRMDYTLIGDAVNLGARLEGANKEYGTRIIISEDTLRELGDGFGVRELDLIRVKGKREPVRIYELLGEGELDGETAESVRLFEEGLGHYRRQEWEAAISKFVGANSLRAADRASLVFIARCRHLAKEPPGPKWVGVFGMTSK